MRNTHYDFAIIGGGPSGLATAVRLSKQFPDKKILLLEKNDHLGGPCYTHTDAETGAVFELGCNDIGSEAAKLFADLGIEQEMRPVEGRIHFDSGYKLNSPFDLSSLAALLHANTFFFLEIAKLVYRLSNPSADATLETITEDFNETFRNMVLGLFYVALRTADQTDINVIQQVLGTDSAFPQVPVGGMSLVIEKMQKQLGDNVEVRYGANCRLKTDARKTSIDIYDDIEGIITETIESERIISSVHGWEAYKELFPQTKPPLPVTAITFEMSDGFVYSDGPNVHTQLFFPKDTSTWLKKHLEGKFTDEEEGKEFEFAFHCFNNRLINDKGGITVYILTPEGKDQFTDAEIDKIKGYVIKIINSRINGFESSVQKSEFYSPHRYQNELGFNSRVMPVVSAGGKTKIPHKSAGSDNLYYVGSATEQGFNQTIFNSALKSAERLMKEVLIPEMQQEGTAETPPSSAFFTTPQRTEQPQTETTSSCLVM